ncbi:MAG TPA: hypothetical protein VFT87_01945 [Candidatus Saccharimonadales bacterium]|nr:hypothetical protein [Candidatus Saccharimonadales bacterium]
MSHDTIKHMLAGLFFAWWYGLGWMQLIRRVWGRVIKVLQFFSVGLMLGSLFAPFRQISAGSAAPGSLNTQLRSWGDQLFSRVIGAMVRLILVIVGLFSALLMGLMGLLAIILWPFLPIAPLIGIFLMQARAGL